jgi:hypothetical protein
MILGLTGLVLGPYFVIGDAMKIPRSVTFGFGMLLLSGIWWVSHHFHKQDEEEEAMSIRPDAVGESH